MTEFTILYHGVPIGSATTPPREPEPDEPAWFRFCFLDFRPLAAYETVAPVLRLASRALANFGYVGPAADPVSDEAGRAAYAAAQRLWNELELADGAGRPIAGRVALFLEHTMGGEVGYWLDVELDAAEPAGGHHDIA